jgi:diguanylate cyclase (GGDEF)-like protein/PAS domain S-box-containing protein
MPTNPPTEQQFRIENAALRTRLRHAEESLRDVLSGEADALFVKGEGAPHLYTRNSADQSYRTLIENMSEGALTMTAEGFVVYANHRFAEMLDTPLEKLIGSKIHAWLPLESQQILETLLGNDATDPHGKELVLSAAGGARVPVHLSVNHLLLDGTDDAYCLVATDLTGQKRNEAILAADKLAQAILEQAADAILICDETGRIIRCGKKTQAFYDKNLTGQLFSHVFPLRQSDGTFFPAIAAIDTSRRGAVEARLERGGQVFDLLVSVGHLIGAGNELLGSVIALTDITERKRATVALQKSEAEFRTLAESMPQIVWITRADGSNIYFNQQWVEYTGLTLEESLGNGWNRPFHPDEQQEAMDEWKKATETAGIYAIETRLRRADGVYRWWLVRGVPLQDAAGKILKWFGTCTDIHDMKVAEHEIRDANLSLLKNQISIVHLNRVYAVLSGINTLIVRVRSEKELFGEACRIAVDDGQFLAASIGIVDHQMMQVSRVASAGHSAEFLASLRPQISLRDDEPGGLGSAALAVIRKKAVVINDVENDSHVLNRKAYVEQGILSMAVLPLLVSDESKGILALFARERNFFDEKEMKLLVELSGDIAFAMDHIEKQARLDYLSFYDPLTGLANRTLFQERLQQSVMSAREQGQKVVLVLMDLERFKTINDSLGREMGDSLLKQLAARALQYSVDAGRMGRMDADHFAVMITGLQTGEEVARWIDQFFKEVLGQSFNVASSELRISAKFGVAIFPGDGGNAEALFRNAEAALKKAKLSGERYEFYAQAMNDAVAEWLTLETQLRQALDMGEFVLHYQPKVNLASGKVTGAEALIRWNDPRTGLVPPNRFIPMLEETGLINEVGHWALRQAMTDCQRWRNSVWSGVRIAVNVSPLQLRNRNFIDEIRQVVGNDVNEASSLELEITESMIMENVQHTIATLQEIRAMGVTIAIDDFGTGFSSLSHLARLPVDTLKIDRTFVMDMTGATVGLGLVSTIINLAHSLKLKVVAEGVETEEQSRLLTLLGCDEMQGYLFSKPVPIEVFEAKFLVQLHSQDKMKIGNSDI